ncbi:MAG: DUF692 domain-containing protein [Methylacidiphilales bacterium]|nr:DUF692 domain-containing protein [Candidatus Methylacidiphilales bacterium]
MQKQTFQGSGLGLRRGFMEELSTKSFKKTIDFFEIAPENWIDIGGSLAILFHEYTEKYPFIAHGLSLSIGSPAPLNIALVKEIKTFLSDYKIKLYSEHLSWCADESQLFDLLPIPFTIEAAKHTAKRIAQVQDILGKQIAIENSSYYLAPGQHLKEIEFLKEVLEQSDCLLLLDINNIYVNSVNHGYDAKAFIDAIPTERIAYAHIAGHWKKKKNLIIDTHGSAVIEPVWDLLAYAYNIHGLFPTLLERDFDFPPLQELLTEVSKIKNLQHTHAYANT